MKHDFKPPELKEAEHLIGAYLANATPNGKRWLVNQLIQYIIESPDNGAAILRNQVGETGLRLIREKHLKSKGVSKLVKRRRKVARRNFTPADVNEAIHLSRLGKLSKREIAKRFDVRPTTINAWVTVAERGLEDNYYTAQGFGVPSYVREAVGAPASSRPMLIASADKLEPTPNKKVALGKKIAAVVEEGKVSGWEIRFLGIPFIGFTRAR